MRFTFNLFKSGRWFSILLLIGVITLNIAQAQQPVFRIGIIGDTRSDIYSGAALAVSEINADGGVIGADGTAFRLELVVQPPDDLQAAVNNINQASVIAAIGPETTQQTLSGLSTLQSLNVPVLTPAIGDTIIASDDSGLIFRIRAPEVSQGRALANYLVNDLNVSRVATIQLDLDSTAGIIGFSTALSSIGVNPQGSFLLDSGSTVSQLVENATRQNPEVIATYGPPELAAQFYIELQATDWQGIFTYNQAGNDLFRLALPVDDLEGIISTTTWAFTAMDATSTRFLNDYVRAFGEVPTAVSAASYDGVYLLAEAIGQPGDLPSNLRQLSNIQGVQGVLNPAQLTRGETSNNVFVTQLGEFGAPEVIARYAGSQRLELDDETGGLPSPEPGITETPSPTATPEGVVATIRSARQNVRTGPSTQFDVLGQLRQGDQVQIVGASIDFEWIVINYRGQQGWLFADLLDIFGDRSSVPVISPPPTPTPGPPTETPTPQAAPDVIVVGASPMTLVTGTQFSVTVSVRNQGLADAGPFAVAASFPPTSTFAGLTLDGGLAAGQQTTVTLTGTFPAGTATGPQSVVIVADLNEQLDEGEGGEANNDDFVFNYVIDRPVLNAGTLTINPGGTLNLEGGGSIDVLWNGTGSALEAQNGAGMYLIPNVSSLGAVHYDLIDPGLATTSNLNVALLPNAYIGIITAEGNRGVIRVDSATSGGAITLTYRVYQP